MVAPENEFDSNAETLIFKGIYFASKDTLVSHSRFLNERVD